MCEPIFMGLFWHFLMKVQKGHHTRILVIRGGTRGGVKKIFGNGKEIGGVAAKNLVATSHCCIILTLTDI